MIHSLRKRHRNIWLVLAILLPILFLLAVMAIPEKAIQENLFQKTEKTVN